jgi:hypothetical protein
MVDIFIKFSDLSTADRFAEANYSVRLSELAIASKLHFERQAYPSEGRTGI